MPTENVRQLLLDGAARPRRGPDIGAIQRKGRLLKRARAASMSALGLAVAAGFAFAAANLDSFVPPDRRAPDPNHPIAISEGWTQLPVPPETRDGMSVVWAGTRLLAWGGCDPGASDQCATVPGGYEFDPTTRIWRRLPDAPAAGANANAVWTGREAIFLFGVDGQLGGQAYDPATGAWRTITAAPIAHRGQAVSVWTGSELVVWGGGDPGDASVVQGAAYDPDGDVWRRIADAPLGLNSADGMWTGREVLVFGSLLGSRNVADTRTAVGAAYDPATDGWRALPPSKLSPQATSAVWAGNRMVAWDYDVHSQEYDATRDGWSAPVRMPFDFDECYPDSVVAKDLVFAFFCGRAALFDNNSGTWEEIDGGPLEEEVSSNGRPLKLWRFAQLASTEDTVFMLAEGITVASSGEACHGCPGSPVSFWAYRPPA
jgi:hypothetical protein